MDGVRLQTKVRWILIDFSKNNPYILSCKHLHINMLMKNNLYIRLSLVFTLFHPVRNSGKPPREMMTVRGIAAMKKDLYIEVQDIMKVWDY